MIYVFFASLYGLLFGSFANAVAYRIPEEESLLGRSHCPKCNSTITAWQNIPVLSWIILRGKCHTCHQPISVQYPLIEILTSLICGLLAWKITTMNLPMIPTIFTIIALGYFGFIGIVLSIIDQRTMMLPSRVIYPTIIFVFGVLTIVSLLLKDYSSIFTLFCGAVLSCSFYFVVWFIFPRGMGFGDVKLSFLTGGVLGWFSLFHALFGLMVPFVILSAIAVPLLITKVWTRKTPVPLGPWIIAGSIIAILWGNTIIDEYLAFFIF